MCHKILIVFLSNIKAFLNKKQKQQEQELQKCFLNITKLPDTLKKSFIKNKIMRLADINGYWADLEWFWKGKHYSISFILNKNTCKAYTFKNKNDAPPPLLRMTLKFMLEFVYIRSFPPLSIFFYEDVYNVKKCTQKAAKHYCRMCKTITCWFILLPKVERKKLTVSVFLKKFS